MKHRLEAYNMPNKHQIMANLFRRTCHLFPSDLDSDHLVHPLHPRLPRPRLGLVLPVGGLGHLLGHVLLLHHSFNGEYDDDDTGAWHVFIYQGWFRRYGPYQKLPWLWGTERPHHHHHHCCPPQCDRRACMESSKWLFVWPTVWPVWHCSPCACP